MATRWALCLVAVIAAAAIMLPRLWRTEQVVPTPPVAPAAPPDSAKQRPEKRRDRKEPMETLAYVQMLKDIDERSDDFGWRLHDRSKHYATADGLTSFERQQGLLEVERHIADEARSLSMKLFQVEPPEDLRNVHEFYLNDLDCLAGMYGQLLDLSTRGKDTDELFDRMEKYEHERRDARKRVWQSLAPAESEEATIAT